MTSTDGDIVDPQIALVAPAELEDVLRLAWANYMNDPGVIFLL